MRGPQRGLVCRRPIARLAILVLAVAGAVAGALAAATNASAAQRTGEVYVVDAVVGRSVSVLLDGRQLVASAPPQSVVGPLQLGAGQHVVALLADGHTLTSARFALGTGQSLDVVAHRAADVGQAARVVVFRNDLTPVGPGKARLVVAHAAVAPPADVRLDGAVLFHDVASGESLSLLVPARTYSVDVVASEGSAAILAPVRLAVKSGTLTRVFAMGDPSNGTADAIVQVLPVPVVGAGRPSSVPTGDGGQAADSYVADGPNPVPFVVLGASLALLVLGRTRPARLVRTLRRRR